MTRRLVATIALALGIALVGAAAPVQATVTVAQHCWLDVVGNGVRFRTQPNTSSTILGLLYYGDKVDPWTNTSGGFHYGYSPRIGRWGWISVVYTQGHCD